MHDWTRRDVFGGGLGTRCRASRSPEESFGEEGKAPPGSGGGDEPKRAPTAIGAG